jgi:hypothetical protein
MKKEKRNRLTKEEIEKLREERRKKLMNNEIIEKNGKD